MRDTYLQLSGGAEYQVSNDRRSVQYRHKPSGLTTWTHFATAPSGMEIEEIKEWHNMCIVKLDDDRWYQRSMNGHGLTLTEEEKRKDFLAHKAEKKAAKEAKKAAIEENSNNSYYSSSEECGEDYKRILDRDIEREIEDREDEQADNLVDRDFKNKTGRDKVEIILSFYNNGLFSKRQLKRQLNKIHEGAAPWYVIDKFADDYIGALKSNPGNDIIFDWRDMFCKQFPFYYENKYPELLCEYERVWLNDPYFKSGFFDIETKLKNKKIKSISEKQKEIANNLNMSIYHLRDSLISIERHTREVLYYENKLTKLQNDNSTNFFGLKKNRFERKDTKESIEIEKGFILKKNKEVSKHLKTVIELLPELRKTNAELFGLTKEPAFNVELQSIEGKSIEIAKNISENLKRTDSNELKRLFGIQQID